MTEEHVSGPSWMLLRLALDTRQHHARADADRIALMDATSELEYRRHLVRIYGFEGAVEAALETVPDFDAHLTSSRKKSELLAQDLAALGMPAGEVAGLPRCVVTIMSPSQAFGWMFVVERLTLLSGLIRRHLEVQAPDLMRRASAYLRAYGDRNGAMFRAFGDECGRHGRRGAAEPAAIVAAANAAFVRQRQWFSKLRVRPLTAPVAA